MRFAIIPLSLFLAVSVVHAENKNEVIQQMEGYRTNIPPPQTLSEQNGIGITDVAGKRFLLPHLSGIAERMHVVERVDLIVLMAYLKDPDVKIRFIAAKALEKQLQGLPRGMSLRNITDLESKGHVEMMLIFAKKIADLDSAPTR